MARYDEMLAAVEELRLVYEKAAKQHEEKLEKLRGLIQEVRDATTASLDGLSDKVDEFDPKVVTDGPDT